MNHLQVGQVHPETAIRQHDTIDLQQSFSLWIDQLHKQSVSLSGSLLLCDSSGILIDINHFSGSEHVIADHIYAGCSWERVTSHENAINKCLRSQQPEWVAECDLFEIERLTFSTMAIPILSDNELLAVVGLIEDFQGIENMELSRLEGIAFSLYPIIDVQRQRLKVIQMTEMQQKLDKEYQSKNIMFEISKTLHSQINVEGILSSLLDNMHELYPSAAVDIYLSHDNEFPNLPLKPLNFQQISDDICIRAFMEGKVVASESEIAAPIYGKQGVYGVLHILFGVGHFEEIDQMVITVISESAGTAFENARLYDQSILLINELRLINEITKRLNQSLRLNEIFNYASSELIQIFNAEFTCILQLNRDKEQFVVQASNLPELNRETFTLADGFSGVIFNSKEPIYISDYQSNQNVYSKLMDVTNSRSLIATPILVKSEVAGVIFVTHSSPNFFTYDNYKLLQVLSVHIGLAMSNASLHAEVRRMVITDHLTGLFARHYLDEQVNYFQKKDECGSLIVVDIDNFKQINDTFGHQVGDEILIQVSIIISTSIREGDIAARWGGEELAIYLPQVAYDQTYRIAERVRSRVAAETSPQVTVSCGLSEWSSYDERVSVESLFYKADMALYEAKHSGKNQIKIST